MSLLSNKMIKIMLSTQTKPSHFGEICLVQDESIRSANIHASEKGAKLLSLTYEDWSLLQEPRMALFCHETFKNNCQT